MVRDFQLNVNEFGKLLRRTKSTQKLIDAVVSVANKDNLTLNNAFHEIALQLSKIDAPLFCRKTVSNANLDLLVYVVAHDPEFIRRAFFGLADGYGAHWSIAPPNVALKHDSFECFHFLCRSAVRVVVVGFI